MRFSEFKVIRESAEKGGFYTIGDSHAVAIATAGGKGWTNLAIGGRSSTNGEMLANISKIPEGAIVVVSQGANDTANAARATMDSGGKRKPVPPATIAANVANVVAKVQAQKPSKVFFMLFPNGPGRGAGLAKYYGGDYQEEVRDAIKGVIDVPIIDINGKPLTDGVHATMAVYKEVANKVVAQSGGGVTLGNPAAKPGAPTTKDKQDGGQGASPKETTSVVDVPTGRRGPAVRDVQQALIALGYKLPKHGADGLRGPETSAAVRQFQTDNGLSVDGDPGSETVGALNKLLASKGIKIEKSTERDVKSVDYSGSASGDLGSVDTSDEKNNAARESAEKFLGRKMDDKEWDILLRTVGSEASNNPEEQAWVMGVVLNRVRKGTWGPTVTSVVYAPGQFQVATGTRTGPGGSWTGEVPNFRRGPTKSQLSNIYKGAIDTLPTVDKSTLNFTAASSAAYGPGTNIGFRDKLLAAGGQRIGQTVFGTA